MQTVDARALHAFLEIKTAFAAWIRERIDQYGFIDGTDFAVISDFRNNPQVGRPSLDYVLTLDMAKELAMVERTARALITAQICAASRLSPEWAKTRKAGPFEITAGGLPAGSGSSAVRDADCSEGKRPQDYPDRRFRRPSELSCAPEWGG